MVEQVEVESSEILETEVVHDDTQPATQEQASTPFQFLTFIPCLDLGWINGVTVCTWYHHTQYFRQSTACSFCGVLTFVKIFTTYNVVIRLFSAGAFDEASTTSTATER